MHKNSKLALFFLAIITVSVFLFRVGLEIPSNTRKNSSSTLSIPGVGVFFYPWYSHWGHWEAAVSKDKFNPPYTWASRYLPDIIKDAFAPEVELYDSSDERTILWQLYMMRKAHISYVIVSWWGQGTYEDMVFDKLMNISLGPFSPHPRLKWCLLYEMEGYSNPSVDEIVSDLKYIMEKYGSRENYLKINGKPVVFVYAGPDDGAEYARRWAEAKSRLNNSIIIVLKVFPMYELYVDYADSWYQYAPSQRLELLKPFSGFVSPGFWKYDEQQPRLRRSPNEFEQALKQLLKSNVGIKLVETWNEWHEGTQIEPGQLVDTSRTPFTPANSYGEEYIDILNKLIPNPYKYEPEIKVQPSIITNKTMEINVAGSGFPPLTTVELWIDDKEVAIAYTDGKGEFNTTIIPQGNLQKGLHIVIAKAGKENVAVGTILFK